MMSFCRLLIFIAVVRQAAALQLVSQGKSITSKSVHEEGTTKWLATLAVDGNAKRTPNKCYCCAATKEGHNPWYQLDLGDIYKIHQVNVVGRGGHGDSSNALEPFGYGHTLKNMVITFKNSSEDGAKGTSVPQLTEDVYVHNYTLPRPLSAQYVHLQLLGITQYFVICEVYVYAECDSYSYGVDCSNRCGNCSNNGSCNGETGECPKCMPGYMEPLCQECEQGHFGQDCKSRCGSCSDNSSCDKSDGSCQACKSGFELPLCKNCIENRFGPTCDQTCHCSVGPCNTSGLCPAGGCKAGYEGNKCDTPCGHGRYGKDCLYECGKCKAMVTCNVTTGLCGEGCNAGYIGQLCNDTCMDGFYGDDCNNTCDCGESVVCGKTDGQCPPKLTANGEGSDGFPLVIVIAAGAFILVCVVVVVVIFQVKKRKARVERRPESVVVRHADNPIRPLSHVEERLSFRPPAARQSLSKKKKENAVEYANVSDGGVVEAVVGECENSAELTNDDIDINDHEYYGFVVKETDLKVHQLWDYIQERRKEKDIMFHREFNQFPKGLKHPHDIALLPVNRPKTRYKGMFAYDRTRVPLKSKKGEADFINANFINGYGETKKFIASQGPTNAMRDDFWQMIWEQKSQQVVMLTNLVEQGTDKCLIYWPTDIDVTYGDITVSLVSEETHTDFVVRKLEARKTATPTILVTQYHYTEWPDKDVPNNTWSLVHFWRTVAKDRDAMDKSGPIVVHCSAGIGRTGTFIALDNAYCQTKLEGSLSVPHIVQALREQRINMVQTCAQYIYVHEAVADALLFSTHSMMSKQFDDVYSFLKQMEPGTNEPRLKTQYNLIVSSMDDNVKVHLAHPKTEETEKADNTRIGNPSLNAILLPNTKGDGAYITARIPDKGNLKEFWSMVNDRNVKTVVTLSDKQISDEEIECLHSDEKVKSDFNITVASAVDKPQLKEQTLTYKHSDSRIDLVTIKQFMCRIEDGNEPLEPKSMITIIESPYKTTDEVTIKQFICQIAEDPKSIIEIIESVLECQRDLTDAPVLLVQCPTGSKLSGLFCVLLNEICRITNEGGRLNIIQSVKTMKNRNRDIIPTYEQYQYIYEVIRSYLDGGDLYANV